MLAQTTILETSVEMTSMSARVLTRDADGYVLDCDGRNCTARKAASCLLDPEPGDSVMLGYSSQGRSYILAVLERNESAPATVSFPADAELRASAGRVRVNARDGIDLAAAGEISLLSSRCAITTQEASLQFSDLNVSGGLCTAQVEKLKVVAGVIDTVVERLLQHAKNSYRVISETEHLKSGRLHYFVDSVLSLRSKHSVMTAKGEMKIDGERIHMG